MEQSLQIKIVKILSKSKANKRRLEKRECNLLKLQRQIESLKKRGENLTEKYNFFVRLFYMKTDEERNKAICERQAKQLSQKSNYT